MDNDASLMTFPCDFTIKIIGEAREHFFEDIKALVLKHYPLTTDFSCKQSKESHYIAISVVVYAENQPALDALYQELTQFPGIKMVL